MTDAAVTLTEERDGFAITVDVHGMGRDLLVTVEGVRRTSEPSAWPNRESHLILPPIPAFYHGPRSIQDIIDHTVGKMLDLMDIEHSLFRRREGLGNRAARGGNTP